MPEAPIYLDHNATTPVAPEVVEAMWPYLTERFGNPSSATVQGRLARVGVDRAREQLASLIGARPDEIVFTSGGTESNNLAIRGAASVAAVKRAVTSVNEHPATVQPLAHLRNSHGWEIDELPVDAEGRVTAADMPAGDLGLGTVILAHNEVGAVQPIDDLAEAVRTAGGLMHTDGAQAVGKIPVSVAELGADLLSIAGHKLYAPKGVGALWIRRGIRIDPVLVGAGQERGIRPGTENVASIVGLGAAAELAAERLTSEAERQAGLREDLWHRMRTAIPDLVRISPSAGCLPNTLMVAVPSMLGADLLERTEEVDASTGSACHSGVHTPSSALLAMGFTPDVALGALRLSLGRSTAAADIERAAAALAHAANTLAAEREHA